MDEGTCRGPGRWTEGSLRLLDDKGHRKIEISEEQRTGDRMVNTWHLIRKCDNLVVTAP